MQRTAWFVFSETCTKCHKMQNNTVAPIIYREWARCNVAGDIVYALCKCAQALKSAKTIWCKCCLDVHHFDAPSGQLSLFWFGWNCSRVWVFNYCPFGPCMWDVFEWDHHHHEKWCKLDTNDDTLSLPRCPSHLLTENSIIAQFSCVLVFWSFWERVTSDLSSSHTQSRLWRH